MGPEPPEAPHLRSAAEAVTRAGLGGWICDERWRTIWVSDQTLALAGEVSFDDLGLGRPLLEGMTAPYWLRTLDQEDVRAALPGLCAWIAGSGTTGDMGEAPAALHEAATGRPLTPDPSPILAMSLRWQARTGAPAPARTVWIRLRDEEGAFAGSVTLADADLPAEVAFFLTRGDPGALQRMVRLVEPGRRAAAILFADLQSSGTLARSLTAAAYFDLIQTVLGAIDMAVVSRSGSVGKHAGDGATAFFTAEELGSSSAAALAAIEAARAIREAVAEHALPRVPLHVNTGIHWSSSLYMGQLITDGRLEVTALGDAVNECARLQETAREGSILASKALLEQLSDADAAAAGVQPDDLLFTCLADLPHVAAKAIRDAGAIPVTAL